MSYPYSEYVQGKNGVPPFLLFEVGSRGFGLHTAQSDIDLFHVEIDLAERLNISKAAPLVTKKLEFRDAQPQIEVDYMELGAYIEAVFTGSSLKAVETAWMTPIFESHSSIHQYNLLKELKKPRKVYVEMYEKEVQRRFRKVFFKKINPEAKNYNSKAGFDTKEASHLMRVIHGAFRFLHDGVIKTNFEEMRQDIYAIRSGQVSQDALFEHIQNLISQIEVLSSNVEDRVRFPHEQSPQTLYNRIVHRELSNIYGRESERSVLF